MSTTSYEEVVHHLISSRYHPSLDQEVYGLGEEGLIRGVVHHFISSRYHPLLDQEVYGLGEEGLIRGVVHHLISSRYHPLLDQEETPITPMEVPSTPPVVPLVASSPPSIEATLVHEELVHIANDDQQGQKTNRGRGHGRGRGRRRGRGAHGGLHVSPIEPLVEHAHHRRPLRKRKAPSCDTH
ncbi:hypothetical protein CK203_054201 [Vitis vinifera]|uniref:Uncharacterized protein n=1 Tax=Vitis vinifera TaxID=29760 RepID=A0A438HGC8_VITVI|nr:hypothetical protein CK203_054201 [Vitis vinifera]